MLFGIGILIYYLKIDCILIFGIYTIAYFPLIAVNFCNGRNNTALAVNAVTVYSNGEEYDVNCDGINSEGGIVPPIAEIDGYKGKICYGINSKNEDTINFEIIYEYAYSEEQLLVTAKFSAEKKVDPHSIARIEVTKLPDMVFTAPLWTGKPDYSDSSWYEWVGSLDVNNSISNHIDGMEITYYYANGEKRSTVVNSSNLKIIATMPWYALYGVENVDEYGNYLAFTVTDEGDYKFSISLNSDERDETVYTAKSVDNPNPSIKPVSASYRSPLCSGSLFSAFLRKTSLSCVRKTDPQKNIPVLFS